MEEMTSPTKDYLVGYLLGVLETIQSRLASDKSPIAEELQWSLEHAWDTTQKLYQKETE